MNLLLDTHTFLWFAEQEMSHLLPTATRDLLEDGNNQLYVSLASRSSTSRRPVRREYRRGF